METETGCEVDVHDKLTFVFICLYSYEICYCILRISEDEMTYCRKVKQPNRVTTPMSIVK